MFPHRHVKRIRERRVLSGSQKRGFLKWRAASTSTSPVLDIFSVNLATIKSNSLSIPISIKCTEENQTVETLGLIDSGARGKFIDQNFAKNNWTQNSTTPTTNHCPKRRWDREKTWKNNLLRRHKFDYPWKNHQNSSVAY